MKKKKERYMIKCMCPPTEIFYFYTIKGNQIIDKNREITKNKCPNLKVFFILIIS